MSIGVRKTWSVVASIFSVALVACANGLPPTTISRGAPSGSAPQSTYASLAWRAVASLGIARSHLSAVSFGSAIYAIGGVSSGGPITGSAVVERYDPQTGAWTKMPDLPVGADHTAAAATESQIFVFGGTFALPSTRAYRFDLAQASWEPVTPLPEPRAAAGAAFLDGRVYVVGGFGSDRKELAPAYSYEPGSDRWERIPDLPTPREHLAVVAYRGSICALGGHFGQADQVAIVECYDPNSRQWSSLPPLIHATSDFAAVVSGTEIWTVGDYVQVFDGSRWSMGPQPGTPRFGVAAVVLDHAVYVIGGAARKPAPAGIVESLDLP